MTGMTGAISSCDLPGINGRVEHLTEDDANLRAAQRIEARVEDLIEQRASFLVETVLSSDKHLKHVLRAKALGCFLGMIYVALPTPDMAGAIADGFAPLPGRGVSESRPRA